MANMYWQNFYPRFYGPGSHNVCSFCGNLGLMNSSLQCMFCKRRKDGGVKAPVSKNKEHSSSSKEKESNSARHQPTEKQNATTNTLEDHYDLCKFCNTLGLMKGILRCANCKHWRDGKRSPYNKRRPNSTANLPQDPVPHTGAMGTADQNQNQDTSNDTVHDESNATAQGTSENNFFIPEAAAKQSELNVEENEADVSSLSLLYSSYGQFFSHIIYITSHG